MPQIWPMNWITLFLLFISILLIVICLIYFNVSYTLTNENLKEKIATSSLNWKW